MKLELDSFYRFVNIVTNSRLDKKILWSHIHTLRFECLRMMFGVVTIRCSNSFLLKISASRFNGLRAGHKLRENINCCCVLLTSKRILKSEEVWSNTDRKISIIWQSMSKSNIKLTTLMTGMTFWFLIIVTKCSYIMCKWHESVPFRPMS